MVRSILAFALLGLVVLACLGSEQRLAAAADKATPFAAFVDEYFEAYFARKPSEGTAAGLHQYDNLLEDFSAAATTKRIETLLSLQVRLATRRAWKLVGDEVIDAEFLDGLLQAELLDLAVVRNWRRNPMGYFAVPPAAIDNLIKRDFAPPAVFVALKVNMEKPPKEFTELAIGMGTGSIEFYRDTLRDWAKTAAGKDAEQLKAFETANTTAMRTSQRKST